MDVVAWVALGNKGYRSVHLERLKAEEQAVKHRGVIRKLVLEEDVSLMLQAAYEDGVQAGREMCGDKSEAD